MKIHHKIHKPVLLEAVLDALNPKAGESYLDLTAGFGGHAQAILEKTQRPDKAVLVDRDQEALSSLHKLALAGAELIKSDYHSALTGQLKQRKFDMILMDLGVSSLHFDKAQRGFSIAKPGPLDMRMDQSSELTANMVVNQYSESQLSLILEEYGDIKPKQALRLTRLIIDNRPITTTNQLANLLSKSLPKKPRIHPATTVFQAIRIAVNDEINQLKLSLPLIPNHLNPSGRLAIISFHSLEDRIVKQFLNDESRGYEARLNILTKRPISGQIEDVHNPRARSAKLRAACENKNERSN